MEAGVALAKPRITFLHAKPSPVQGIVAVEREGRDIVTVVVRDLNGQITHTTRQPDKCRDLQLRSRHTAGKYDETLYGKTLISF